jgi:hypothetical protein
MLLLFIMAPVPGNEHDKERVSRPERDRRSRRRACPSRNPGWLDSPGDTRTAFRVCLFLGDR